MIFISININSFYEADKDTARYRFRSAQEKMCKFSRTRLIQQIKFARIPAEFVARFITYQNRVKVITFPIAA